MNPLDEGTLHDLAIMLHTLNRKARGKDTGHRLLECSGRCFELAFGNGTYKITGEVVPWP